MQQSTILTTKAMKAKTELQKQIEATLWLILTIIVTI